MSIADLLAEDFEKSKAKIQQIKDTIINLDRDKPKTGSDIAEKAYAAGYRLCLDKLKEGVGSLDVFI